MASQEELDKYYIDYVNNTFNYEEDTGKIYWKRTHLVGQEAGCTISNKAGNNYKIISFTINGKQNKVMAHRLAWIILYGKSPVEVDHLDGDGLNNISSNLREVTRSINNKNHRRQSNNTSGIAGVSFHKQTQKWRVYSYKSFPERKQIYIGLYETLFEACCARKSYEIENGFSERHGK